ncbi:guanylate kinase [Celerinatantimonas yamalensis]|uniref:Guanylate kinase n=1 Tax=Celerinatantimonas yamalensis TaxID=559956 RepID=A0ABW9GAT1_9GAMM
MAKGTLYIISAPSGAGKSSMISALINRNHDLPAQVSISHTTRSARPGEQNGVHYHFVDKAQFEHLIEQGAFFEYAQVFGNYYGTSRFTIEATLARGIDVFLDIDWQGARQIRQQMSEVVSVFILPPSREELEKRLKMRGQDSDEVIQGRMTQARDEISHYDEYDYLIINQNFDEAVSQLQAILQCHRLRQRAQALKYQTIVTDLLVNESEID